MRLAVPLMRNPTGHWNMALWPSLVPSTLTVKCMLDTDMGSQWTARHKIQFTFLPLLIPSTTQNINKVEEINN